MYRSTRSKRAATVDNPIILGPNNGPFLYQLTNQNPSKTVTVTSSSDRHRQSPAAVKVSGAADSKAKVNSAFIVHRKFLNRAHGQAEPMEDRYAAVPGRISVQEARFIPRI